MMKGKLSGRAFKKCLSVMLVTTLAMGLFTSVGIAMDTTEVKAATLNATGSGVTAPAFNASNFPTLNTDTATQYYFGKYGNAFYGVSDGSETAVSGTGQASGVAPYWELVDTDASMNGNNFASTWGSGTDGQTILNFTNALKNTYFNEADHAAMKSAGSDIVTNDYAGGTGSISAADAYLWPLSYTQLNANKTLGGALFSGAGSYGVWSRSCGGVNYGGCAWCVGTASGGLSNSYVAYGYRVAPAFNLDLSKVLIARSASSATAPQSLSAASVASGDLKFLINAGSAKSSFDVPSISGKTLTNVTAGSTYEIEYTGASTNTLNGGTNYVSAIIYDDTGAILYYGNLDTISGATGTAEITIPSNLDPGHLGTVYTLAIFEEEKCAANKTDYASTPVYSSFVVQNDNYETNATFSSTQESSVHVGDTISANSFKANVTYLNGTSEERDVYVIPTADYENITDKRTINSTSVTVPNGSPTFQVTAVFVPTYTTGQSYWTETYTYNLIHEDTTAFNTSHESSFNLNDTFTSSDFSGVITWSDGQTSSVNSNDLYIVPTSVWGTGMTKAQVQALSDYNGGKSIKIDDGELNGADSYSITAVYFPTVSGAEAVHTQEFEFASATLYSTAFEASYTDEKAEYGELLTDQKFSGKYTLSNREHTKVEAATKYVLPKTLWDELSDSVKSNEDLLKKVKGINYFVVPSKSDLNGATSYDVVVVYYDYSDRHSYGGGTACANCNYYAADVAIPLLSEEVSDYNTYTSSGITWYYQLDGDENAINVHTRNEDISQIIDKEGVLNIPEKVDGHIVKSIGAGTKDLPFIPKNINSYTSISFPDHLTDINDYAFYGNTAFMRLVIPESVEKIGNFAFFDCDNISDVKIASSVIGSGAFGNCDGIIEVTITGNGSVGRVAFAKCSNLKKLTIGGTMNIGKSAFSDDSNINAINLKNLTGATIDSYAFKDNTGIKEVYIPNTNEVKAYAFDGCTGITNLELDMATVENDSFSRCGNIQYVIFGNDVSNVEYNWGGYSSETYENNTSYSDKIDTTIYVKNKDTQFQTYRDGSDIYSSFMGHFSDSGSYKHARNIKVYVPSGSADGHNVEGTLVSGTVYYYDTTKTNTAESTYTYKQYYTANDLLTITLAGGDELSDFTQHPDQYTVNLPSTRDGITAYYDGKIYDNAEADKSKIVVNPIYSDAATATASLEDFYFFDAEEADTAIKNWIKNESSDAGYTLNNHSGNDAIDAWITNHASKYEMTWNTYVLLKQISDAQDSDFAPTKDAFVTAGQATSAEMNEHYNFTSAQLQAQLDAMVDDVFQHKDLFLTATADIVDNPEIVTLNDDEKYRIQHMEVIYYPSDEGDTDYHDGEPVYYTTSFDVKVVKYTDEMYFFDQGFSYSTVVAELKTLEGEINTLQESVTELESDNQNKTAELSECQQKLDQYTTMYNEMVEELNKYIDSSKVDESGYFGEVEKEEVNPQTGETETVTKKVVWVGGEECGYTETDETIEVEGVTYDVYTGTGNIDGVDGEETFTFYVDKGGVHIVERNDQTGEYTIVDTFADPIRALERQLTAQLTAIRIQLSDVKSKIEALKAALKTALDIDDSEFEGKSMDEQLAIIVDKVNDLIEEKTTLENTIASNNELISSYEEAVDDIFDQLISGNLNKADFDTLQKKLNQILADIDELKSTNTELSGQVTSLGSQVTTLQGQLEEKEATISEKDRQIEELTNSASEKDASIEELSAQIDELRTQASTLSETISAQSETISSLEENVDELSQANTEMQEEISSLNNSVYSLSESNAAQSERITALSEELDEKQSAIDAGSATIEELTATIASARTTIGELQSENDSQAQTITSMQSNISRLEELNNGQATTIQNLNNDIADLHTQNESLSNTIASLQSTITSQSAEISNLNEAISAKNAEITLARNQIQSLNTQLSGLQTDLATAQNTIDSQQETITTLEENAGNYILTIDDAAELFGTSRNASKAEVIAAINTFVATKVSNEKTIKDIQEKLSTTADGDELVAIVGLSDGTSGSNDAAVLALRNQVTNLTTENNDLSTQVTTLTAQKEELERQVKTLTDALAAATKNSSNGSGDSASITALTTKLNETSDQVASLTSSNAALKKKNAELSAEVESISATNESLRKKTQSLTSSNSSLQSQYDSLSNANNNINNQLNAMNSQVSQLTNEKNHLNEQVTALTAQNNSLSSQVQQLQSQKNNAATTSTRSTARSTDNGSAGSATESNNDTAQDSEKGKETDAKTVDSEKTESTPNHIGVAGTLLVPETDPITTMSLPGKTTVNSKTATVEELDGKTVFAKDIRTNAASVTESSEEAREHANAIFNYYAGNLDKLSELGFEGTETAKEDDDQVVSVNAVFSVDVHPSDAQKEAMEKGEKVDLSLASSELENGKQYLLVHESTKRTGKYDVTLVTAHDKEIITTLQDLSPVSVAKVSLENIAAFAAGAANPAPVGTATIQQNDNTNTVFVVILIALIIGGGVGLMIFMKKKQKDGKGFNFHRA